MPRSATLSAMIAIGLAALTGTGCQSHRQLVEQAHDSYWRGELDESSSEISKAIDDPKNDLSVLLLDQAMVEFQRGELTRSQDCLQEARAHLVPRASTASVRDVASLLTDDTTRTYPGEDHEKILLQVMLALTSLLRNDGDAVAYAYQIGQQCEELLANRPPVEQLDSQKPDPPNPSDSVPFAATGSSSTQDGTSSFTAESVGTEPESVDLVRRELAVAPFLRAVIRGQSAIQHDELIRNLELANQWRPGSPFLQNELACAADGDFAKPGFGTVYLIGFVGRGPRKIESFEPVSSQALLVADQILSAVGDYTLPPTIAPIKISRIELSPITVDSLQVAIDGNELGCTEVIADIGRLAVERQREMMPQIIGRSIARRVVKKSLIVAGKSASNADKNSSNDVTSLVYTAAGIVWEATEKADLRAWALLPGSIQVFRAELPAGRHEMILTPSYADRAVGKKLRTVIEVFDGRTTFAIASVPDLSAVGKVLISK